MSTGLVSSRGKRLIIQLSYLSISSYLHVHIDLEAVDSIVYDTYSRAQWKSTPAGQYEVPMRYLRGTYEVPTKYLRGTYEVPTKYLRSTYEVPTKYLRSTYEVPMRYL